jgi:hypothetical protein
MLFISPRETMILLPFLCRTIFEDVLSVVFPGRPLITFLAIVMKLANFITLSIALFKRLICHKIHVTYQV